MDFSKLSRNEKMAVYASIVVVVTALISIANAWGALMFIPLLAGIAALAVIFAPQVMPSTKMPGSNGTLLTILGAATVLVWLVVLLDNFGWVMDHIVDLDTFQFVIGLIAAVAVAWFGWQILQAEGGKFVLGTASADAGASADEPPPSAPPAAETREAPAAEPAPVEGETKAEEDADDRRPTA